MLQPSPVFYDINNIRKDLFSEHLYIYKKTKLINLRATSSVQQVANGTKKKKKEKKYFVTFLS